MRWSFRGPRLLAVVALLAVPAVANAAITGTVKDTAGQPLEGATLELSSATDANAGFATSKEDGTFAITPSGTGPFTLAASAFDDCRSFGDPARNQKATLASVADPSAGVAVTLDVRQYCTGTRPFATPSAADASAFVDGARRLILGSPGSLAYVRAHAAGATDVKVTLQDGTPISAARSNTFEDFAVTLPAAAYDGPLKLVITTSGGTFTRDFGRLIARQATFTPPLTGVPYDVEAIVDVSGSMGGTDPKFLRKDALNLLADLSGTADGLGAVGFDDAFQPIFELTKTTNQAVVNALKVKIKTQVINRGSTDYNIGMDTAFDALNAAGVDPNKPKMIIFLTDGGHNAGTYNNGHLRFTNPALFNGTTQRSWPVCVVQLGPKSSFQPEDVARLQRIASETGGKYFQTQSSASLNDIYFQCRGQSTGQKTVLTKNVVFVKAGQQRQFNRRLAKGLRQATFFVNSGGTFRFQLTLIDPQGRRIVRTTKRPGLVFRNGNTFQFFRVTRPAAGNWRVIVKATRLVDPSGKGQVTISVPVK